jgi:Flp pilus assembly protein TadG
LRRLRDNTSGNVLAICAAAIIPLAAVIGSALDLSDAYMTRQRLQNACDAGVLAGRQYMQGTNFNDDVEGEARKFFNFNFPAATPNVTNLVFDIEPDATKNTQLNGSASALVPTTLMRIFGYANIPVHVSCDAVRDMGHNDIMLVLDVTGSMADAPSSGGASKISRLREGAMGLYKALESDDGSITRYGIVPYSHTVNVAGSLMNKDILDDQPYAGRWWYDSCDYNSRRGTISNCVSQNADIEPKDGVDGSKYNRNIRIVMSGSRNVPVQYSYWNNAHGYKQGNTEGIRTSGDPDAPDQGACIEERPSVGESMSSFKIRNTITRDDVDKGAGNAGNEHE